MHEASSFQALLDRISALESELKALKLETLRQDIQVSIDQADRGEFSTRTIDDLKLEGRRILAERK